MKIDGAIFDMDGTLLDSLSLWDSFWPALGEKYFGDRGYRPTDEVDNKIKTLAFAQGIAYMKRACGIGGSDGDFYSFVVDRFESFYTYEAKPKDGAIELLEYLKGKGVKMCVASATELDLVKLALKVSGLEPYFDGVYSCSAVGKSKDEPDIFYYAAKMLGTDVADTCVFEDSCVALETAKKAGFKTVGVYDERNFGHDRLKNASIFYVDDGISLDALISHIN